MKKLSLTFQSLLRWMGFASFETEKKPCPHEPTGPGDPTPLNPCQSSHAHHHHGSEDQHGDHPHHHLHSFSVQAHALAINERGIWAIRWSFIILTLTALFQIYIVWLSSSVALLADTLHNIGDAASAIPLWIAFRLGQRKPSRRFSYGHGRFEDLAGLIIVFMILLTALAAGYQAIHRLMHPETIAAIGWVIGAGLIGFIGNELVAALRIHVGRQINSAALIADGYHARTDGLTSLAVVFGAVGVWLGFPLLDPLMGLLITFLIFGIVWHAGKTILMRLLDGIEPSILESIDHTAEHIEAIHQVLQKRARWLGHALNVEVDIALDGALSLSEAEDIASKFECELIQHLPTGSRICIRTHATHSNAPRVRDL